MSSQAPLEPCNTCSCRSYILDPRNSPGQCWCGHHHEAHGEPLTVNSQNPPPRGGIPGVCSVWVDPSNTFDPSSLCASCHRPWFTHEPIDNTPVASGSPADASLAPVTSVWQGPARIRNTANDSRNEVIARHSAATSSALSSYPVTTTQVNRIRDGSVTSRQASLGLNGRMAAILARQSTPAGTTTSSFTRPQTGLQGPWTLPDGRWTQQYFVILLPHSTPTLFDVSERAHFVRPADRPTIRVSAECMGDIIRQAETWNLGGRLTITAGSEERVDDQLYTFLAKLCNNNGFTFSSSSYTFPLPLETNRFVTNPFILLKAGRKPANGDLTPFANSDIAPYDQKIPILDKLASSKHLLNPHERTGVLLFGTVISLLPFQHKFSLFSSAPKYRLDGPLIHNGPSHACFSYQFHLTCRDCVQPAISQEIVDEFRTHSCDACGDPSVTIASPPRRSARIASSSSASSSSSSASSSSSSASSSSSSASPTLPLPISPTSSPTSLPPTAPTPSTTSRAPTPPPPPSTIPAAEPTPSASDASATDLPTVSEMVGETNFGRFSSLLRKSRRGHHSVPCIEVISPTVEDAAGILIHLLYSHHNGTPNTVTIVGGQTVTIVDGRPGRVPIFNYSALGYGKHTWKIGGTGRAVGPGPERQILEEAVRQIVGKRNLWVTIDEGRGVVSWDFTRLSTPERSCWAKVTGSLMSLYILWQEITGFPMSPFLYTLFHSLHTFLLANPLTISKIDPTIGSTWEKWPLTKPADDALSLMTPNDPLQQFLLNNIVPARQPVQYVGTTQEEWDVLSEIVLCSLLYGSTPDSMRSLEDISNLREGANFIIAPSTGITFLQVFSSSNGPSLTRQVAGGRLRSPNELIDRLEWEEPSPTFGGNTIVDSANDPNATPFMACLKAYLLGRGHPQQCIEHGMFDQQVDEDDVAFRASLFLLAVSGTQLVPTDPEWKIMSAQILLMTDLVITPLLCPVIWAYASIRDTADQSHRFLTAAIDLAVNPGEILGLLSKCNVASVGKLQIENSKGNIRWRTELTQYAIPDVCKKFPSTSHLEVTCMSGHLQGIVLSSFLQVVHLTLHIPLNPPTTAKDLPFNVLETLVLVDRKVASSGQLITELSLIGNLNHQELPVREFIRKFSDSILKLVLLEDNCPLNRYVHLQFPRLPRLKSLVVESSWAPAAVYSMGVRQEILPLLQQVVLQADLDFVYSGMPSVDWAAFFDGLASLENRVEVLRLEIRGESMGGKGSFTGVFTDIVREEQAETKIRSFRMEEGLATPLPKVVHYSEVWGDAVGSPDWRAREDGGGEEESLVSKIPELLCLELGSRLGSLISRYVWANSSKAFSLINRTGTSEHSISDDEDEDRVVVLPPLKPPPSAVCGLFPTPRHFMASSSLPLPTVLAQTLDTWASNICGVEASLPLLFGCRTQMNGSTRQIMPRYVITSAIQTKHQKNMNEESESSKKGVAFTRWMRACKKAFRGNLSDPKFYYLFHVLSLLDFNTLIWSSHHLVKYRKNHAPESKRVDDKPLSHLEDLPNELVVRIVTQPGMNIRDLFNLFLVSSFFCNFVLDPSNDLALWRFFRERHGFPPPPRDMSERDWWALMIRAKEGCCDLCSALSDSTLVYARRLVLCLACIAGIDERPTPKPMDTNSNELKDNNAGNNKSDSDSDDSDSEDSDDSMDVDEKEEEFDEDLAYGYSDEFIYGTAEWTFSKKHFRREYPQSQYPMLTEDILNLLPSWTVLKYPDELGGRLRRVEPTVYDVRYWYIDINRLIRKLRKAPFDQHQALFIQMQNELEKGRSCEEISAQAKIIINCCRTTRLQHAADDTVDRLQVTVVTLFSPLTIMAPHKYANQGREEDLSGDELTPQVTHRGHSRRGRGGARGQGRGRGWGPRGSQLEPNHTSFAASRAAQLGVSLPSLRTYSPAHIVFPHGRTLTTMARRKPESQIPRLAPAFYHRLLHAERKIPLYYSKHSLSTLEEHAGSMEELEHVKKKLGKMLRGNHPVIGSSCRLICPKTNKPILTYLAERIASVGDCDTVLPASALNQDKTMQIEHIEDERAKGTQIINDGFLPDLINRYAESATYLAAYSRPKKDKNANRHGEDAKYGRAVHRFPLESGVPWTDDPLKARVYRNNIPEPGLVYSDNGGKEGVESAGMFHFSEGWEQCGHPGEGLYQSKDMNESSTACTATAAFYETNSLIEQHISSIVKVFWPEHHEELERAREAARTLKSEGGCFNSCAIIFKLPLFLYCDDGDTDVSVSFPAGKFTGGYMYIPQLGLIFEYKPGTVIAFRASKIFHTIGKWEALPMKATDGISPGRIGTVFYFPESSLKEMRDKEPGWALSTNYGRTPSSAA
ncbi:hypothetical protein PQX77_006146 [Marasmius sp. AFHP31]|nr:hypothetical protein PQX77_006146 [Marasmius sp. AFHP31]